MIVVSDTSPIINLAVIGQLNLLPQLYEKVVIPHDLHRGETGAVVECYPDDTYEVEFVAQDGVTYALLPLSGAQLIPLREKPVHDEDELVTAAA